MKKVFLAAAVAMTALFTSCNNGSPRANLKTDIDTLSYEMGMAMSQSKTDFENYLAQSGSDSAYVDELLKGYLEGMNAADDKKKMAYYMGVMQGLQTKMQMPMIEQQVFQGDSTKKVSVKNFAAGFMATAKGKSKTCVVKVTKEGQGGGDQPTAKEVKGSQIWTVILDATTEIGRAHV